MYLKTLLLRIQSFFTWAKRQLSRASTESGYPADSVLGQVMADTGSLSDSPRAELSRSDGPLTVRVIPEKSASQEITVKIESPEPIDAQEDFEPDTLEASAQEAANPIEAVEEIEPVREVEPEPEPIAQEADHLEDAEIGNSETLEEEMATAEAETADVKSTDIADTDTGLTGVELADADPTDTEASAPDEDEADGSNEEADESSGESQEERPEESEDEPFQIPDELFIMVGDEQMALTTMLESLLFVAEKPTEPLQFAKVLGLSVEQIEAGLLRLGALYKADGRGVRVLERNERYVLVTMPTAANTIETFLNLDLSMKLSGPALEALAIVAYRQPVTRQQIESVRGVDCGHVLRILLQHGLIEEVGRLETAGRPILYGVTDLFMQHFGLTSLGELPKLEITEADLLWASTEIAEEEGVEKDGAGEDEEEDDIEAKSAEEEADDTPVVDTESAG